MSLRRSVKPDAVEATFGRFRSDRRRRRGHSCRTAIPRCTLPGNDEATHIKQYLEQQTLQAAEVVAIGEAMKVTLMTHKCDLHPCFGPGDPRTVYLGGELITRNQILAGRTKSVASLDPDAQVVVVDHNGNSVSTTVGVVKGLLSKKDLIKRVRSVLPRDNDPLRAAGGSLHGYYEGLNRQHFDTSTAQGSVFTEVANVEDLVELAVFQGVDLATADDTERIKESLRASGTPEEEIARTFRPGVRYVTVETPGLNGLASVAELAQRPDASRLVVRASRAKPGVPLSFTVGGPDGVAVPRKAEDTATVIIGRTPDSPDRDLVFTAHPGLPVPSSASEPVDVFGVTPAEDEEMSLADFQSRFPQRGLLKIDSSRVAPL